MSSLFVLIGGAGIASAATVYEITGRWAPDTPETVASGDVVTAEWRVNVNDDAEAPGNEPVDNVNFTVTLEHGLFDSMPDACLTSGVDPVSSISADQRTLVCNLGPHDQGTAVVVQTGIEVEGETGDEVGAIGTIDGETAEVEPIPIDNPFMMDIAWGSSTRGVSYAENYVDLDLEWTLFLGEGSDPGPSSFTYTLDVTAGTGAALAAGPNGCSAFTTSASGSGGASGHPWSGGDHPIEQMAPFVGSCTLTQVDADTFTLTLSGIDYSPTNVPTHDSVGQPLPTDRVAIASGSVWFRVQGTQNDSISLISDTPTYTSPSGDTFTDDASNNRSDKSWVRGGWSNAWRPEYSGIQVPSWWSNQFYASPGTMVDATTVSSLGLDNYSPTATFGQCVILDTQFVTYDHHEFRYGWNGPTVQGTTVEYYVGAAPSVTPGSGGYDPNSFSCADDPGGWTTQTPTTDAQKAQVKAVRVTYPFSSIDGSAAAPLMVRSEIKDTAPVGQDIWEFGELLWPTGEWQRPSRTLDPNDGTGPRTPGERYPYIGSGRDVLYVVGATPAVSKTADQAVIKPGVAVTYTLAYSANGIGVIPPTVDDYELVDTLPLGMTYEPGSASPEPAVATDAEGRQVLTWSLDGVPTNAENTLTYQAVADDSVEPGQTLTNTVEASLGGVSTDDSAQVTVSTSGHTVILKTADVEYIPNVNGDGVGTGSWTVAIESFDPLPQAFTDTIDILPYNGDQRGTSFSGTYTLDEVVTPDGGTVYYTDADPATLSDDPAHEDNGAAGDATGNTVGWTTTRPENPTAIRVIGGELLSGETFSFQVVITTNGARGQDVYVNRAQARTEHTELVMRTSAPLVVTDYSVAKTSDPAPGSTVKPGDTVTYSITVTQEGPVPAAAVFTDTLADVLDDAVYNEDATADIGTVTYADGVLSWEGVVPVGEVATITFTVTVKDVPDLESGGADTIVDNSVWSPGCPDEVPEGEVNPCEPPPILVGYYTQSKTSDPVPGTTVGIGDVVTYHVQITQVGEGAVEHAFIDDDLTAVLDDATYNDDAVATSGEVTYTEPTLSWDGPLAVGEVVDLTYSVTVTGEGDYQLENVVTSVCPEDDPDCLEGICVPAPDQNADCKTVHPIGDYRVMKTSDPVDGSEVEPGDVVTYTVTVRHIGIADVEAGFDDDLTQVLDDATWNDDVEASLGEFSYEEPTLTWSSVLSEGEVATVTYSVTVTAEGDRYLENVVTPLDPEKCEPAPDQDEQCKTVHINGAYTYSKTSDPVPGSVVEEDGVITYTVLISHVGEAPVEGATIEDDLSAVLDDAVWNDDAAADSGEVSFEGTTLTWTGDLEVGQVVTLTYSVTANAVGEGDDELVNVVTDPTGEGVCVPAEDGNEGCTTDHYQGEYVYSKTSDPEPGSQVEEGEVVTYTVTVEHIGAAPIEDAIVVDDLSQVAPVADWNDDATATSGQVSMDDEQLTWTGDLEVGQVVTITYSVTVGDKPNATMRNVVTSPDDRAVCVPAADGNPDCRTDHHTPDEEPPAPDEPDDDLPDTGAGLTGWFLTGGMALLIGGLVLAATNRRRPWGGPGGTAGLSS